MWHSVGWEGTVILDRPHQVLVNTTIGRSNIVGACNVFHELYPEKYFQEWMVFQVFELVELRSGAWAYYFQGQRLQSGYGVPCSTRRCGELFREKEKGSVLILIPFRTILLIVVLEASR